MGNHTQDGDLSKRLNQCYRGPVSNLDRRAGLNAVEDNSL